MDIRLIKKEVEANFYKLFRQIKTAKDSSQLAESLFLVCKKLGFFPSYKFFMIRFRKDSGGGEDKRKRNYVYYNDSFDNEDKSLVYLYKRNQEIEKRFQHFKNPRKVIDFFSNEFLIIFTGTKLL